MSLLLKLPEELKLRVISHLPPADVLILRQTCQELAKLSRERSVWISQYDTHIRSKGYPSPTSTALESMSAADIERQTHICDRVAQKWVGFAQGLYAYPHDGARFSSCHRVRGLETQREKLIRDVWLVNIHGRSLVLLHYKDDWSVLELWDVGGCGEAAKLCEWAPKGTIIKSIAVNTDLYSEATLAVGVLLQGEEHAVQILNLSPSFSFEVKTSLPTLLNPVTLQGDIIGLGDHLFQTVIWNWKTTGFASLNEELAPEREGHTTSSVGAPEDEVGSLNPVYSIYLSGAHVFVARAYSLTLFAMPERFHPSLDAAASDSNAFLAKHSFGCVDALCMTQTGTTDGGLPTYRILVRGFSDDAWKNRDDHLLQVYTLDIDDTSSPSCTPYRFPPRLEAWMPTKYGRLNCTNIYLGNAGVALWAQPKARCWRPFGYEDTEREYIYAAILPDSAYRSSCGSGFMERRRDGSTKLNPILLKTNHDSDADWTCMDWDEASGRIALGLRDGSVTLIEM